MLLGSHSGSKYRDMFFPLLHALVSQGSIGGYTDSLKSFVQASRDAIMESGEEEDVDLLVVACYRLIMEGGASRMGEFSEVPRVSGGTLEKEERLEIEER